jgi:hypothetical protein
LDGQEQSSSVTIHKGQTLTLKALADGSDSGEVSIVWEINGNDAVIISSGIGAEVLIRGENINAGSSEITAMVWRPGIERLRSKTISIFVTAPPPAAGIANLSGPQRISVGEEQLLAAELIPVWADGTITWSQYPLGMVELSPILNSTSCVIRGLTEGEVTITAAIGTISKSFDMQITPGISGNPVTGLRIKYTGVDNLPVSNIVWLFPGDTVTLEAEWTGGLPETITWTVDSVNEVRVGEGSIFTGNICVLTGVKTSDFKEPPVVVRITAINSDNINPINATVLVKTLALPIWAWDRARDGGLKNNGNNVSSGFIMDSLSTATGMTLTGRGEYTMDIPVKVSGNPNLMYYTDFGLKMNSSNSLAGNTDPANNPNNSTRITIGTNSPITTNPASSAVGAGHQPGVFNFLEINQPIRISVDYEIIWSAGASRDMWIMVNNNNANAAQSILSTNSQLLIEPLIAARGTRATAVTTLDVQDLIGRQVRGYETLENAFIAIIALSNGGSIYVSGIRIERE